MSDSDRPKPIPVRPPSSSRKKEKGPDPAAESAPTPTPVRDVMGDAADEGSTPAPSLLEAEIAFESDGDRWVARSGGRTRSGAAPDSGAPLFLVFFHRAGEDGEPAEEPEQEAWAVGHGLDDLTEGEVELLLARSRPYQGTQEGAQDRRSRSRSRSPSRSGSRRRR